MMRSEATETAKHACIPLSNIRRETRHFFSVTTFTKTVNFGQVQENGPFSHVSRTVHMATFDAPETSDHHYIWFRMHIRRETRHFFFSPPSQKLGISAKSNYGRKKIKSINSKQNLILSIGMA